LLKLRAKVRFVASSYSACIDLWHPAIVHACKMFTDSELIELLRFHT